MERLFLEGLVLQASLIFALGAQNLFVFESGLRREHSLIVSLTCFICDLIHIMLGVGGAATILTFFPQFKIFVGVIGVFFLFRYGLGKLFIKTTELKLESRSRKVNTLKRSVLLAITFSVLNPHAYLDAFVLIGGYSSKYIFLSERLMLGLGAAIFSGLWFVLLSSASSYLKPLMNDPLKMKKLLSLSGALLILLSGKLGLDVWHWITQEWGRDAILQSALHYPLSPGHIFTSILY